MNAPQTNHSPAAMIPGLVSDANVGGPSQWLKRPIKKTTEKPLAWPPVDGAALRAGKGELELQARWFAGEFGRV
ncbi:MAG: hypothetical protein ORN83_02790, partial [Chthoniobacteraceae bacterium]|nr:hypothetical protein [Chthoniobacteraceae bacterium]